MTRFIRKLGFLTAIGVLCFASSALATDIGLTFTSVGGNSLDGEDTYPYNFNFTQVGNPSHVYGTGSLICDDYANTISFGQSWNAQETVVSTLTSGNIGTSGLYFVNPPTASTALMRYQEVAYLALWMFSGDVTNRQEEDINWAIWSILDVNNPPNGTDAGAAYWETLAANNYQDPNVAYNDVTIYTPYGGVGDVPFGSGPQEFIGVTGNPGPPNIRTPEASTVQLSGVGLLGLVLMFMFRRRDVIGHAV